MGAVLGQAMGPVENINSIGKNWMLGQRCKTGEDH